MSMNDIVSFPGLEYAWLLYPVTVFEPVQKRRKVKFIAGRVSYKGRCSEATFMIGKKVYHIDTAGNVTDGIHGRIVMHGVSLVLSEKRVREMQCESAARWACNPASETYQSM